MDAKELRIGNTLNYTTSENDVVHTTIDWQNLKWISEDFEGFNLVHSPIPLTEEWLVNFGFEKNNFTLLYELKINCFTISFEDQEPFAWYVESVGIDIEYVHELQNLHFGLTGEELTIQQQ